MLSLFVNQLMSGLLQAVLFAFPPFLWWLLSARKREPFLHWLGLKKPPADQRLWRACLLVAAGFILLSVVVLWLLRGVETATAAFAGAGFQALPAALVYAFLTTALSEEILFRGFLLKRLSARLGFVAGNLLQSLLFGLLHGAMLLPLAGVGRAALAAAFTGAIGWCMGYVNERRAGGSILPGWAVHGLANTFSSVLAMFSIL